MVAAASDDDDGGGAKPSQPPAELRNDGKCARKPARGSRTFILQVFFSSLRPANCHQLI